MKKALTIFWISLIAVTHMGLSPILAVTPTADPGGGDSTEIERQECNDKGGVYIAVPLSGQDKCQGSKDRNPIWDYVASGVKLASSIFGLLVILMIVVSGIQYITSQGNPEQYKNAKSRLTQAVTGLILFILMFGILNYLIPGGILK